MNVSGPCNFVFTDTEQSLKTKPDVKNLKPEQSLQKPNSLNPREYQPHLCRRNPVIMD